MSEKRSTSVSLTVENLQYLDREVNNRSAFINDLIEAHRNGKSDMEEAIARHRKEQLLSEKRRIEQREEQITDELESLNKRITEEEAQRRETIKEAKEALDGAKMIPENPAVENWAKKADLTPEELIEELQ